MATILGLNGKMFRNTGTYASPTWTEMKNVKNLTMSLEKGEADVSSRSGSGWRQLMATLITSGIDFQMVYDQGDADFTALQTSFFSGTAIEYWIADGASTPPSGSTTQGLRAGMMVFTFGIDENLEEAFMVNVTLKPTRYIPTGTTVVPPTWHSVTTP